MKALAQDSVVMVEWGTASSHLEVLSIMVRSSRIPDRRAEVQLGPGAREKTYSWELEYLDLESAHASEPCSAGRGDMTLSRG